MHEKAQIGIACGAIGAIAMIALAGMVAVNRVATATAQSKPATVIAPMDMKQFFDSSKAAQDSRELLRMCPPEREMSTLRLAQAARPQDRTAEGPGPHRATPVLAMATGVSMRKTTWAAAALAAVALSYGCAPNSHAGYERARVIDGDTLALGSRHVACGASTRPSWRKRAPINSGFAITAEPRRDWLAAFLRDQLIRVGENEKDRQLWPRHRDLPNDKRSGRCPGHRPCRLCRRVHALYRPVQGRRDTPGPQRPDLRGKSRRRSSTGTRRGFHLDGRPDSA